MSRDPIYRYARRLQTRSRQMLETLGVIEARQRLAHNAYTRYMQYAGFETGRKGLERFHFHEQKYVEACNKLRALIKGEL